MTLKRPADSLLLFTFTLVPVLLYGVLLISFSQNIPWIDDYFWYFGFLEKSEKATSISALWQVIITPYNNHWHAVQRLIILLVTKLTGHIPLVAFSWVGNLLYVCLFYFFASEGKSRGMKLVPGVVASSWLFFQPVSYYNFFECAFFNLPVLLFSFLATRAFSNGRNAWYGWAILATFSNGNGILIWPTVILMALRNRDWRAALQYSVLFTGLGMLYLFVSRDAGGGPGQLSLVPLSALGLYFIQLVGSIDIQQITLSYWWLVRTGLGLAILAVFLWLGINLTKKEQTRWFFCVFILMTMGVISLTRKEVNHFSAEVLGHYWMFPQLFLAGIFGILIDRQEIPGRVKALLVSTAIVLSLSHYSMKLPQLNGQFAHKTADLLNYQAQGKLRLYPPVQGIEEYKKVNERMDFAVRNNYYTPPVLEKEYLPVDCAVQANADGSIAVSAPLPWRMLSRLVIVEVNDHENNKTYLPVDPSHCGLRDWLVRKKNRRVDAFWAVQWLIDPLSASEITQCRILVVN